MCAARRLSKKFCAPRFPEIPLLGEEGDSGDVSAEYRWVVDPIDGTVNYFFGMPHAAVSIALQKRAKWQVTGGRKNARSQAQNHVTCHSSHVTVLGVIYGPFTDELWTTIRGEPTRLNGKWSASAAAPRWRTPSSPRLFQKPGQHRENPAAFEPARPARQKNPHPGFRRVGVGLRRQRAAGRLH